MGVEKVGALGVSEPGANTAEVAPWEGVLVTEASRWKAGRCEVLWMEASCGGQRRRPKAALRPEEEEEEEVLRESEACEEDSDGLKRVLRL